MHSEDQEKTSFITKWGTFVAMVMMFGLKTALATFQHIIIEIFGDFIPTFMQVFLTDFVVCGTRVDHLSHLRLCLEQCRTSQLSLNPSKCAFEVTSKALLGHIVSKDGIAVDPGKNHSHSRGKGT